MQLSIKHEVDNQKSKHAHTTLIITQDDMGRFWLSALCSKNPCEGQLLLEVMPEQVARWENNLTGIEKEKGEGKEAA